MTHKSAAEKRADVARFMKAKKRQQTDVSPEYVEGLQHEIQKLKQVI